MNKKGFVLVTSYMIVSVLLIVGIAFVMQSFNERKALTRDIESLKALNIAEAGIDDALYNLKSNPNFTGHSAPPIAVGEGCFTSQVTANPYPKLVTATGCFPGTITTTDCLPGIITTSARVKRILYATAILKTLNNFYDNAMYVAGAIDVSGTTNSIVGNVRDGVANVNQIPSNLNVSGGQKIADTSVNPLARLNFETLKQRSLLQNNYHNAFELQYGSPTFPTNFYYNQSTGEPNIIYLEGDLKLSGNTTVGGFFVVAGEVLTNFDAVAKVTISGTVQVNGCIYSRGTVTVAGTSNINGGIWAGSVTLNGNIGITQYNPYLSALQNSGLLEPGVQMAAWRDDQYPFQ